MGVVYKLTPNISSFIVEQKQMSPKMSCQDLADKVFAAFGQRISKSSVHELLKTAHVIVPRSRIIKDKFQIPQEKKEQISREIAHLIMPVLQETATPRLIPDPVIVEEKLPEAILPKIQEPVIEKTETLQADIFLKCALWDLSFKPVMGLKDFKDIDSLNVPVTSATKMEWDYLTQLIYAIKIELEDKRSFFIDSRFENIYPEFPFAQGLAASIERTACETADYILNNIDPVIIQEISVSDSEKTLYDFISSFENSLGKAITKVSLMNAGQLEMAEFNDPVAFKRKFIVAISSKHQLFQWFINKEEKESLWEFPIKDNLGRSISLKVCKKEDLIIITNMVTDTYDKVVQNYCDRFPSQAKAQLCLSCEQKNVNSLNQGQWLIAKLKERALMFFPKAFPLEALEEISTFQAIEIQAPKTLQTKLLVPENFRYTQELKQAIQIINNLHIRSYQGRIIRIFMG